jgi:hypothetical protein
MVGTSATVLPCMRCCLEKARMACFSLNTGMMMSDMACSCGYWMEAVCAAATAIAAMEMAVWIGVEGEGGAKGRDLAPDYY